MKYQVLFWCFKKIIFGIESWNIKLNFNNFSVRGCWGQQMLLFWKLDDETQMGNSRHHATRDILSKFSIFLPLRAILKKTYHYETPCSKIDKSVEAYCVLRSSSISTCTALSSFVWINFRKWMLILREVYLIKLALADTFTL